MSLLSLKRIVEPSSTPVSLSDMKAWLRVDSGVTADDDLISSLIVAATDRAEDYLGRSLMSQEWRFNLDYFPTYQMNNSAPAMSGGYGVGNYWWDSQAIYLPRCPLISVDSLTYIAVDGTETTLDPSAYQIDSDSEPARILPVYNSYWPTALTVPNAITITFTAGYSTVPEVLNVAIKLMVSALYENPSNYYLNSDSVATIPLAAERLMAAHRISPWDYSAR